MLSLRRDDDFSQPTEQDIRIDEKFRSRIPTNKRKSKNSRVIGRISRLINLIGICGRIVYFHIYTYTTIRNMWYHLSYNTDTELQQHVIYTEQWVIFFRYQRRSTIVGFENTPKSIIFYHKKISLTWLNFQNHPFFLHWIAFERLYTRILI